MKEWKEFFRLNVGTFHMLGVCVSKTLQRDLIVKNEVIKKRCRRREGITHTHTQRKGKLK